MTGALELKENQLFVKHASIFDKWAKASVFKKKSSLIFSNPFLLLILNSGVSAYLAYIFCPFKLDKADY